MEGTKDRILRLTQHLARMNPHGEILDQNLRTLLGLSRIAEIREGELGAIGRDVDVARHGVRMRACHFLARDVERLSFEG